jgi:hypothetical protein
LGYYINPPDMTKEQFLATHGRPLGRETISWDNAAELPVCLVDNGPFTAAAIAYSPEEFQAFNRADDYRPKQWFMVPKEVLKPYL